MSYFLVFCAWGYSQNLQGSGTLGRTCCIPPIQDDHSRCGRNLNLRTMNFTLGQTKRPEIGPLQRFLNDLRCRSLQEQHGYTGLGDILSCLPLPTTVDQLGLSVHYAMEAGTVRHAAAAAMHGMRCIKCVAGVLYSIPHDTYHIT
jgi:hypothetical protein